MLRRPLPEVQINATDLALIGELYLPQPRSLQRAKVISDTWIDPARDLVIVSHWGEAIETLLHEISAQLPCSPASRTHATNGHQPSGEPDQAG